MALVFAMVLLMSGLSNQFRKEPRTTVEAIGGDFWVVATGATGAFTSDATIPGSLAGQLRTGGRTADPIALVRGTATVKTELKDVQFFGYKPGGLGAPVLADGSPITSTGQVIGSEESGLATGDTTKIGGKNYRVVGTTKGLTITGGTPVVFMAIADVQARVYQGQDVATAVIVKGPRPPKSSTYEVQTLMQTYTDALRPLEKPVGAIDAVQVLLWLVAATIIGAVVYLSALERRRDFAVLKAVGASSRGLLAGLATQSIIVALVAAVVATGIQFALVPVFPIPVQVPGRAYVQLPILALLAGALASLGGLRKAVNVDPALAFSGPGG